MERRQTYLINTFNHIILPKNVRPLVICDIDNTFIRPFYEGGIIEQTDPNGFIRLIEKINELNGQLIFLTARSIAYHSKTINDLKMAGLHNPDQYTIHYTNNVMNKGEYIKKCNLLEGYTYHVFIDDCPEHLNSASVLCPLIQCYLFKSNKYYI